MLFSMKKTLRQIFTDNLKFYRNRKGYTQTELDIQIDKTPNYTNGIENRNIMPNPETIEKICEVLEIEPKQLFDSEGSPSNIMNFDKESFTKEVTDELYRRLSSELKPLIHREISEAIEKIIR